MADGLLLSRRERARLFWLKFACGFAPQLLLGVVALAVGGGAVGSVILILGTLFAFFIASSARRPRGAAVGGLVCATVLFVFQLVVAWFATHPIE